MGLTTSRALELSLAAHVRLVERISGLTDEQARQPSLLPDWTVGHVLTHLARNADGHALRLSGALRGEEVARYPGGSESRDREIADGAGRPAEALVADVAASNARLEAVWRTSEEAGWPHAGLMAGDIWPTVDSPFRRLREVEIHHFDLGLGYSADEWPDDYAAWELEQALTNLPGRLGDGQARRLLVWLIGRAGVPDITPTPWP
jgi:maleylpyruvate isomerase